MLAGLPRPVLVVLCGAATTSVLLVVAWLTREPAILATGGVCTIWLVAGILMFSKPPTRSTRGTLGAGEPAGRSRAMWIWPSVAGGTLAGILAIGVLLGAAADIPLGIWAIAVGIGVEGPAIAMLFYFAPRAAHDRYARRASLTGVSLFLAALFLLIPRMLGG